MDYMEKREVKRVLKGLNLEIQWARREILRSRRDIGKQSWLQRYKYLLGMKARECHLKLAFANGTPYAHAERSVKKPAPHISDEMACWVSTEKKMETYSEDEYSYSLAG